LLSTPNWYDVLGFLSTEQLRAALSEKVICTIHSKALQERFRFADIVCIARKYEFNWKSIINEAIQKDTWVNPLDLAKYFYELDAQSFDMIQWITPIDVPVIMKHIETMVDEIVKGSVNSVVNMG